MFAQQFLVGRNAAYRDEITFARKESPRALAQAPRGHTLDWAARLVFRVSWPGGEEFRTDPIEVHGLLRLHPEARVSTMLLETGGRA